MKGILVVLGGLGDSPHKFLQEKTPLEAAETPNLNFFSARGELGFFYPVKPGFTPSTEESIFSIFGNNLKEFSKAQFEARGEGFNPSKGELAISFNFATIDSIEKGNIIDRRAGRTLTDLEAELLVDAIDRLPFSHSFEIIHTLHHKGILLFKGSFSENVSLNDSYYSFGKISESEKISKIASLDKDDNSQYTSNILNEFLTQVYNLLNDHPVNKKRKEKGLLPANYLLFTGVGTEKPKVKQYKKWICLGNNSFQKGFGRLSGMDNFSFEYPYFKNIDSYGNFWEGIQKGVSYYTKILKKNLNNTDYVYLHINETNFPGQDNKPLEKKEMLEYLDKNLFGFLRKFAPPNGIKVIVTGDNSTVCKLKKPTSDPVPVLFYNGAIPRERKFNEKEARKGTLGRIEGHELLKRTGFVK